MVIMMNNVCSDYDNDGYDCLSSLSLAYQNWLS